MTRVGNTKTGIYAGGKVVDSAGNPIEGAEVALIRDISPMKNSLMEGDVLAAVKTGTSGAFDFESMPTTGTYLFRARHADFTTGKNPARRCVQPVFGDPQLWLTLL